MISPRIYLYTQHHIWIEISKVEAKIGITGFAKDGLGNVTHVQIPGLYKVSEQNAVFGKLQSGKKTFDLVMPVSGEIIEINPTVISNPEIINMDPYFQGWIARVKLHDAKELDSLFLSWRYEKMISKEKML